MTGAAEYFRFECSPEDAEIEQDRPMLDIGNIVGNASLCEFGIRGASSQFVDLR